MKKIMKTYMKSFRILTIIIMCAAICIASSALTFTPVKTARAEETGDGITDDSVPVEKTTGFLYDTAGLLSDAEASDISEMLAETSERQQFAIVILTIPELPDGYTSESYADDFYDYNGFGYGAGKDGVLLFVSMKEREWHVSTTGFGIKAITDRGLEAMSEQVLPPMSDGDYYTSFKTFIELCDDYVAQARNGKAYDIGNLPETPKAPFNYPKKILISLVIGLIVGLIVVMVMKGKLRSVRAKGSAAGYMRPGSMDIKESRDTFLYMNVTKTERPKESSSGGSSTHRSSSGTSHGGGGGHF